MRGGFAGADKGLLRLRVCKKLTRLSVNSTKITIKGARRFNSAVPKGRIVFAPTDIEG